MIEPMRLGATAAMAVLILCAASFGSAQAAEPSAASAAVAPRNPIPTAQVLELSTAMTDLRRSHLTNLTQMEDSLGGMQRDVAVKNQTLATMALLTLDPLVSEAIIYQRMECESDKAEVLRWLPEILRYSRQQLDRTLEAINSSLPLITNQALLSETQAVRDGLQKLRSALEPYSYDPR